MAEMVDKVAEAVKRDGGTLCISHDKRGLCRDPDGCICRSVARKAIFAMETPTPAMVDAGRRARPYDADALESWGAMIREALK